MEHRKQSMRWLVLALSIGAPACGDGDGAGLLPGQAPVDEASEDGASTLGEGPSSVRDDDPGPMPGGEETSLPTPPGGSGACASALEPNDNRSSACPITIGERVLSSLSASDEADFFSVGGLAGHTYTLDVIATGACSSYGISSSVSIELPGQPPVELLGSAGQGSTRVAREFTPPADGRIVIELEGGCGYELVVWSSTADGLAHDPQSLEPNPSPSTATALLLDVPAVSAVTASTDPTDFFSVDVTAGERYTLDVIATGACSSLGITTSVALVAPSGRVALLDDRSQGTTRVAREFQPGASGRAVIQMSGNCGYELALLRATTDGLGHDAVTLEPNNSPSTASSLAVDAVVSSTVASGVDPDDYFEVPVVAGRRYALELIGRGGCSSLGVSGGVSLSSPSGTTTLLAAVSQGTTRSAREFSPNADGVAVVEVSGQCAYDVVVHQASADGLEHDATSLEPNNSPNTGTPLALDELVVSQTQSGEDPDDYFIVPVEADATYTLQLTATGACSSLGITASAALAGVAGSSALLSASSQGTNTTARAFTPAADGDAIVRIAGNCSYELQVLSP